MYLVPNKFMNFNSCILKTGAEILKILLVSRNKIKYTKLYEKFEEDYKENTEYIFLPALSFLYLVGKIDYNIKKDTVELIKWN